MDDRLSPVPEPPVAVGPSSREPGRVPTGTPALHGPRRASQSGTFRVELPGLRAGHRPRQLGSAAELVRAYLREHLEGVAPTIGQVARGMGLGKRTLQRRLRLLGTSYQALLEEVRQERFEALSGAHLCAADLADALGYSDPRCVRRWRRATRMR